MYADSICSTSRIANIGAGHVGAAAAYVVILESVASEILLVDVKVELQQGDTVHQTRRQ